MVDYADPFEIRFFVQSLILLFINFIFSIFYHPNYKKEKGKQKEISFG